MIFLFLSNPLPRREMFYVNNSPANTRLRQMCHQKAATVQDPKQTLRTQIKHKQNNYILINENGKLFRESSSKTKHNKVKNGGPENVCNP